MPSARRGMGFGLSSRVWTSMMVAIPVVLTTFAHHVNAFSPPLPSAAAFSLSLPRAHLSQTSMPFLHSIALRVWVQFVPEFPNPPLPSTLLSSSALASSPPPIQCRVLQPAALFARSILLRRSLPAPSFSAQDDQ
eukprot:301154-Rhodomonas_salina.1